MNATTEYQVCAVNRDAKTATVLETISAGGLSNAVEIANSKDNRETIRIFPLVTLDKPETIMDMARFTLASCYLPYVSE